jgi:hypothetical protein
MHNLELIAGCLWSLTAPVAFCRLRLLPFLAVRFLLLERAQQERAATTNGREPQERRDVRDTEQQQTQN